MGVPSLAGVHVINPPILTLVSSSDRRTNFSDVHQVVVILLELLQLPERNSIPHTTVQ